MAMQQGLRPVVVVNKIDRASAEVDSTIEAVNDLFLELATEADQLDFPIVYASAKEGYALVNLSDDPDDMAPLFDAIIEHIPGPTADPDGEAQMLVTSLDYDNHLGQIAIGRISRGMISKGDSLVLLDQTDRPVPFRADYVFSFRDLGRHEVEKVVAGDIAAVAGVKGVTIGDTIASPLAPEPLERITIEEPTVKMTFGVNTSPFSGKDGKYATSRVLWDRLERELQTNVSLRVERTDSADEFTVSGRGELHLSVLIENMRREGMEFQVSKPEAIITIIDGSSYEPYERIVIETPQEFVGALTEELSSRMGQVEDMQNDSDANLRIVYVLPTRGLIGFRSFFLKATRGSGIMSSELLSPRRVHGEMRSSRFGAIVASESGVALSYGIRAAQERGQTFIDPTTPVYEGMIVGWHNRDRDLELNIAKERKMTNVRTTGADILERLEPPVKFSLEESLDFIAADELAEITPSNIRLRKRVLKADERRRVGRSKARSTR